MFFIAKLVLDQWIMTVKCRSVHFPLFTLKFNILWPIKKKSTLKILQTLTKITLLTSWKQDMLKWNNVIIVMTDALQYDLFQCFWIWFLGLFCSLVMRVHSQGLRSLCSELANMIWGTQKKHEQSQEENMHGGIDISWCEGRDERSAVIGDSSSPTMHLCPSLSDQQL